MSANILVVDDMPANLELLASILVKEGYEVRPALSGSMALMSAQAAPPDLILLDVNMPDKNGYEVCYQLKDDEKTRDIPVIFISAMGETIDKVRAFGVGGVDYITKPFQIDEVLARIQTQLTLYYQRRELERLREKERQYFDEMNRLKDEFVRTVSHDLKSPIASIVLYTDMLKESLNLTDKEKQLVQRILEGAERMNTLIVELLDLARIESGGALVIERVPVGRLLEVAAENHVVAAQQKNIDLQLDAPAPDIMYPLDPNRMEQVLNNLISNAIKYTPDGGTVWLSAEDTYDEVLIHVRDNGLGIPERDLPFLFDKFYRVGSDEHMQQKGTGLGLAIVKAIVEQHGATIRIDSQVGKGTTFTIALPR